MTCNILSAYGLVNKQKGYGINCSFFDHYRRDFENSIRTDTEAILTSQNANIVGYENCTEDCDVFYTKLPTYTCVAVITNTPNNLRGAYKANHAISYNRTTVGVNNVEAFTVTFDVAIEWNNPAVLPSDVLVTMNTSVRGVGANVIYPFNTNSYTAIYQGTIGTKKIYRISFFLDDIDNTWLIDDNYRITYNMTAMDSLNTANFSFQTRFVLTAGVMSGIQNP